MAALYLALRLETAWLEAQQGFAFKAQPMTLCAYELDVEGCVDLTDMGAQTALGVTPAMLGCAWERLAADGVEPPSWALARRLRADGVAGVRVPSFAPGATPEHVNLVLWSWGTGPPHRVRVVDDERRLPRDDRSWRPPPDGP